MITWVRYSNYDYYYYVTSDGTNIVVMCFTLELLQLELYNTDFAQSVHILWLYSLC